MHRSPSFTRIHSIDIKSMPATSDTSASTSASASKRGDSLTRYDGSTRCVADARSSSTSRFSQPNQAHLPSLKMLSERLGTPTLGGSKSVPVALSEMSTNVPAPAEPTAGRLKLPASAMARAQITPSPPPAREGKAKSAEVVEKEMVKEKGVETKDPVGSGANGEKAVRAEKEMEKVVKPVEGKKAHFEEGSNTASEGKDVDEAKVDAAAQMRAKESRASLGVGYKPQTPQTPQRKPTVDSAEPPAIVVQNSTPGKGEEAEEGATVEEGEIVRPDVANSPMLPLAHSWTLFYDSKTYKPEPDVVEDKLKAKKMSIWEASLLTVGEFDTVQSFARLMNNIRTPSQLGKGANYHLFKDGIRPSWEDPANTHGGKWVLFSKTADLTDACWSTLVMALVGEVMDPDNIVTGIVVSPRPRADRLQIWMRSKNDVDVVNAMAARILDTIAPDSREMELISLEFQSNKASETFPPNKFMRIGFTQRSASAASSPVPAHRRLPGSPAGSHSPLAPSSPRLGARALPMQRGNSGNSASTLGPNNPFTGPMGASRRLVSTPKDGAY